MKFISTKEMNKIAKSTLAIAIAGTFTVSASIASAAETSNNPDQFKTVILENPTTDNSVQTESKELETATINQEGKEEFKNAEKPSLVPGSFFYFAKIAFEKIKLALTFDNEKEAKLLAAFAAERLAEAETLFAAEKEGEALKVIEEALNNITYAEEQAENKENKKTEEDTKTTAQKPADEIQELISQNIIALQAAMEKVKNPVAKAALQKNIDKSYAKLAKKIAKLNKKYGLNEELAANSKVESPVDHLSKSETAVETDEAAKETENDSFTTVVLPEKPIQADQENKVLEKAKKAEPRAEAKKAKELAKIEKKQKHEAAKQEAKKAREQAKQAREQAKQQRKEVKKAEKQVHDKNHSQKNSHKKDKDNKGNGKGN